MVVIENVIINIIFWPKLYHHSRAHFDQKYDNHSSISLGPQSPYLKLYIPQVSKSCSDQASIALLFSAITHSQQVK